MPSFALLFELPREVISWIVFFGWIGGKKLLRNAICDRFPDNIKKYVEVFGGAGWVLFHKDRHAPTEVYNDVNGELVNLFRVAKFHHETLAAEMDTLINAREIFEKFKFADAAAMTDIQRATRFLYLIRASYGCKMGTFGAEPRNVCRSNMLRDVSERLKKVVVENLSFETLIPHYDGPDTLFYCDPPYYGAESFYNVQFGEAEHRRLRDVLAGVKGRFILSYNDCEFVRELYEKYKIEAISRSNNLSCRHGSDRNYHEIIITNY